MLSHRSAAALWGFGAEHAGPDRRQRAPPMRCSTAGDSRPRSRRACRNRDVTVRTSAFRSLTPVSTLDRPGDRTDAEAARADGQRGGQARRDRPGRAARRARRLRGRARRQAAPHSARPPHLPALRRPSSKSSSARSPQRPVFRSRSPKRWSTASRSTSTGPTSASWSRPTAGATTARPSAQTRDALRDQTHTAAGLTPAALLPLPGRNTNPTTSAESSPNRRQPQARLICTHTRRGGADRAASGSASAPGGWASPRPCVAGRMRPGRLVDARGRRRPGRRRRRRRSCSRRWRRCRSRRRRSASGAGRRTGGS